MRSEPPHLVFAGGGTGGHLFPGLAVAGQLAGEIPGVQITFVGSGKQFERREVAAAGFEYLALPCRPLPKGAREAFSFLVENLAGYLMARRLLEEQEVAAVVGLGGYASVPMARAASHRWGLFGSHRMGGRGLPLMLLEQNAVPGRATRWLARSADVICVGLAQTRANLRCRCPVRVTGTPIRSGPGQAKWAGGGMGQTRREEGAVPEERVLTLSPGKPQRQLVILGGSSGAGSVNQNVPRALYKIGPRLAGWRIIHQSGERELNATRQLYRKLGLEATVISFTAQMPQVLAASDLAVSRAGGTTLAELAAAGVPTVLLPYPHAADDHQRHNADVFTRAGGSVTLDERELPGRLDNHLADAIQGLLGDPGRRARMSAAMRRLARPNAAAEVAALIVEAVEGRSGATMPAAA